MGQNLLGKAQQEFLLFLHSKDSPCLFDGFRLLSACGTPKMQVLPAPAFSDKDA